MTSRIKDAALGFDANAGAYEASRPSYPAEAVAHIVGHGGIGPGTRVLDLAAGTGKLTRLLVPTGAEVVAVEPVAGMRDRLTALLPGIEVHDGAAVALAELRRVLRPGGHLFLVWNVRDRDVDWVRAFGDLLVDGPDAERPYDSYYEVDYAAVVARDGGFPPVQRWDHAWDQPSDPDLLVSRAESVSVVGTLPPVDKARVLDRVRNLAATHPDLAGRDRFPFPYVTRVWRTTT